MSRAAVIRVFAGSALASLLVFLFLSWPLARFAGTGIPASAQNFEQPPWRYSMSGDHLQLLYHFDLMRDMLHGRIPWFQDPYEFNEGRDEARHRPGSYFFPMSAVYSLLAETLGQAGGWNLTLWMSVCFSTFFSWMWLRRFTTDSAALCLGTAVILLSPFRWISLFGGSPAGIALMWLSCLAWGVDSAVRKATWGSGVWVGGALLLLFWADLQTFYLAALFLPVFVAISLWGHGPGEGIPWRKAFRMLPGILCFLGVIAVFYLWKKENLAGSAAGAGRSWDEVRLFSPSPAGFALGGKGADDWIFVGIGACVALAVAWVRLMVSAAQGPHPDRRRIGLLIFLLAILGIAGCLAVGVHGPGQGGVLKFARDHLPYYAMIRQPAKIMAVIPLWIGWLLAVGFSIRAEDPRTSVRWMRGLALAFLLAMAVEVASSYSATICLLEPGQGAYERVAREAEADGAGPGRLLVVPLWPGDSMDTAVPMYFCQKYNLRMINGYSPVVRPGYIDNVFRRLESVNQGLATDEQIDFLLERGIRFLLVHEDMYPEKVSPFPVAELFRNLTGNPRIRFLAQSGPVHAFRLLPKAEADPARPLPARRFPAVFPARHWEAEQQAREGGAVLPDGSASGGAYWLAAVQHGEPVPRLETRPARVAPAADLAWWIRVRGAGRISIRTHWGAEVLQEQSVGVANPQWDWHVLPISAPSVFGPAWLEVSVAEGEVQMDLILLAAGQWPREWPGPGLRIPAASFFHAGYAEADGTVVLRRAYEPDHELFYGPRMPLPGGTYSVEVEFTAEAPEGAEVARFGIRQPATGVQEWVPLRAGTPARLVTSPESNLPWVIALKYNRTHDLKIHAVTITREAGP